MARQLALFDAAHEHEVDGTVLVLEAEPTALVPDAGQLDIFAGPHREVRAMEEALDRLDAAALRALHAEVARRYPRWSPVRAWPRWAEGVEWLAGTADAPLGGRTRADRALALMHDATARVHFPEAHAGLVARVRAAAAAAACDALIAEEGPRARLADGRAAGTLPLRAGNPARAVEPLRAASAAGLDDGETRAALAESLWQAGDQEGALSTWRDALLRDPGRVDERGLPGPLLDVLDAMEELELRGDRRAWLPALADLMGVVTLPPWAEGDPGFGDAGAFAAELAAYRRRRAAGELRDALLQHKRKMIELAPALRELVRRL